MSGVSMSARLFMVALRLLIHVSDQEAADSIYRVLRRSCVSVKDGSTYPNGASLEVHAATLTAEQDAEIRRDLFSEVFR